MNVLFRSTMMSCFLFLFLTLSAPCTLQSWNNDISFIRQVDRQNCGTRLFLKLNALRKKRPSWWKIMPATMHCVQKNIEKNTTIHDPCPQAKKIFTIFAAQPPLSLSGWQGYVNLWHQLRGSSQDLKKIKKDFHKFWIQSKMTMDAQDHFCAFFLCPTHPKDAAAWAAIAHKNVHIDRMIALILEQGLMSYSHIACAEKLGSWLHLGPEHPLMLICRILKRGAHINDPTAIQAINKISPDIASRPLISMAKVSYFIRSNQISHAIKAWKEGARNQTAKFKDPYLQAQLQSARKSMSQRMMRTLWQQGQKYRFKNQKKQARSTFLKALSFPYPTFLSQSVDLAFLRGMIYFDGLGQYKKALYQFQKVLSLIDAKKSIEKKPLCRYKAKALFWSGLCYERMKNKKMAMTQWKKASRFCFYFYGQMAQYKLGRPITMHFSKADVKKGLQSHDQKQLVRIINTLDHQDKTHQYPIIGSLLKDLEAIGKTPSDKKKTLSIIAQLAPHKTTYAARVMSQDASCVFPQAYPMAPVPIPYKDPALIHAIILSESAFEPNVISVAGAQGLMQIMPKESEHFCQKLSVPYDPDIIFDPAINIRLGIAVLKDKQTKMRSMIPILASYNAGETKVSEWLKQSPRLKTNNDVWIWMESVPFHETREYVPRTLGHYATYRWMGKKPMTPKDVRDMLSIQNPASKT